MTQLALPALDSADEVGCTDDRAVGYPDQVLLKWVPGIGVGYLAGQLDDCVGGRSPGA